MGCAFENALLLIVQLGCLHPSERDCRLLLVHNFNVPRYYHKKPAKKLSKVTNVTEVKSFSYTSHSSLGSTRTGFPQLSAQIKCNELCSNNSQCDDICNSKACAYENLDCNEKLRKLVSLFLRCTPQKKPSAMPIVQPHQNKFRVFLLIAQLMVRKLFLGAHFKMPFC